MGLALHEPIWGAPDHRYWASQTSGSGIRRPGGGGAADTALRLEVVERIKDKFGSLCREVHLGIGALNARITSFLLLAGAPCCALFDLDQPSGRRFGLRSDISGV